MRRTRTWIPVKPRSDDDDDGDDDDDDSGNVLHVEVKEKQNRNVGDKLKAHMHWLRKVCVNKCLIVSECVCGSKMFVYARYARKSHSKLI